MTQTFKSVAGIAAALTAAMAFPAAAESAKAPITENSGMVVVRDAATGKLRAPTAVENDELLRSRAPAARTARTVSPAALAARSHQSGARGVRMTDEQMHHSVMVRNADGTLSMMCVDTNGVAHALHEGPNLTKTTAAMPPAAVKLQTE